VGTSGNDNGFFPLASHTPTSSTSDLAFVPDRALTGSELSFCDNFVLGNAWETATADIHVVELATTVPSTLVVAGADPRYMVSSDKKYIAYAINYDGNIGTGTLYSVPVP
jgi:hypothetical protein